MAKPWLSKYLNVPPSNVYGADLVERNGRFTGSCTTIPIGQVKVELLKDSVANAPGAVAVVGFAFSVISTSLEESPIICFACRFSKLVSCTPRQNIRPPPSS